MNRTCQLLIVAVLMAFSLAVSQAEASYMTEVLADNPVAYYRLEEATSSATAADSSGNALDGTYINFPDPATADAGLGLTSPVGNAIHSDPNEFTWVQVPDDDLLDITGALTLEAVINLDALSLNNAGIIGKYDTVVAPNQRSYVLTVSKTTGELGIVLSPDGAAFSEVRGGVVPFDEWVHVAAVFDPGTIAVGDSTVELFINGVSTGAQPISVDAIFSGSAALSVASYFNAINNQVGLDGFITEAAVYNTSLSDERILAHANAVIPEPGSVMLLGLALVGIGVRRRPQEDF